MTEESHSRQGKNQSISTALTLFEQSIEILERSGPPPATDTLPAGTLPSLLEQCEAILEAPPSGTRSRILMGFPGLPQIEPAWWQPQAPQLRCYALGGSGPGGMPVPRDAEGSAEQAALDAAVQALEESLLRRGGYDLLLTAGPEDLLPTHLADNQMVLLTCHPRIAFESAAREGEDLETFCARLSSSLERYPGVTIVHVEDLSGKTSDQAARLLQTLNFRTEERNRRPLRGISRDDKGMDPLSRLCAQLEYPDTHQDDLDYGSLPHEQSVSSEAAPAQITPFLSQLDLLDVPLLRQRAVALLPQLDACLAPGSEFLSRLDEWTERLSPTDAALASLMAAAHFCRTDQLQAKGLIAEAVTRAPLDAPRFLDAAAALYLSVNAPAEAIAALSHRLLQPGVLPSRASVALLKEIDSLTRTTEHGHALLISHLKAKPPIPDGQTPLMIEIGTTREAVAGQGSTEKLARTCIDLGIHFVTVDMDPRNTRNAQRMFKRLDAPYEAITAKGEDFLRERAGPFDYVFLDAYDFDHGMHSELRQDRYERHLGSRIDETACHAMHLECARSVLDKLSDRGLVCMDDTWTDEAGNWVAKGTTAMPFLLENGFKLVEARNKAALLERS